MPLTGIVDFGATISAPLPGGEFSLIAVDGSHHALARFGTTVEVGHAEAETSTVITEADWQGHVAAVPIAGTYNLTKRIGCPGTPYFWVLGQNSAGGNVVGIRYRIDAAGSIAVDGHLHLTSTTNINYIGGAGIYGGAIGQIVIGSSVYAIIDTGEFFSGFANFLVELPLTGNLVDLGANTWASRLKSTPGSYAFWSGIGSSRQFYNVASLYDAGAGAIGILTYRGTAEGEASGKVYHGTISGAGVPSGMDDVSSTFGLPFPDANKKYDDTASGNSRDDYTPPSITPEGEIIFTRGFSDNRQYVRAQRYTWDGATLASVESAGSFEFQIIDTPVVTEVEAIWLYREGGELLAMMRDNARFIFGFTELAISADSCMSSGFDLRFPPCVTTLTQCVKITRRDGVTFRFTSLDRDHEFRGETYVTCGGLDPLATQVTAQLGEVGSSELGGLIVATGVQEEELYGGMFDDAFVEIWLVDYEGSERPRRLSAGWAGKITHSTRGYRMEVLGPGARLEQRPIVQVYSPQCRWVFGDERCTVDIDALAIGGSVTSGLNRGVFLATLGSPVTTGTGEAASSGELNAQFANGRIRWLTGVNAGQVTEVKEVDFETGQITLWALTVFVPQVGDTFDLLPGCAQDFDTCKTLYDNVLNFGGFPSVPGRDAIMDSPSAKVG